MHLQDDTLKDRKIEIQCLTLHNADVPVHISINAFALQTDPMFSTIEHQIMGSPEPVWIKLGMAQITIPKEKQTVGQHSVRLDVKLSRVPHGGLFEKRPTFKLENL